MPRKKSGFQWVREDLEESPVEPAERRDGGEERQLKRTLHDLARRLADLRPEQRAVMALSAELQEALVVLSEQGRKPSRRRQMQRVQTILRTEDLERIEALLAGVPAEVPRDPAQDRILRGLISGGDEALQAFLDRHPDADRQQLRALIRQAGGSGASAQRAERRLAVVLEELAR
jgi:ribosome-associated protein